jgi:hypothetical protein
MTSVSPSSAIAPRNAPRPRTTGVQASPRTRPTSPFFPTSTALRASGEMSASTHSIASQPETSREVSVAGSRDHSELIVPIPIASSEPSCIVIMRRSESPGPKVGSGSPVRASWRRTPTSPDVFEYRVAPSGAHATALTAVPVDSSANLREPSARSQTTVCAPPWPVASARPSGEKAAVPTPRRSFRTAGAAGGVSVQRVSASGRGPAGRIVAVGDPPGVLDREMADDRGAAGIPDLDGAAVAADRERRAVGRPHDLRRGAVRRIDRGRLAGAEIDEHDGAADHPHRGPLAARIDGQRQRAAGRRLGDPGRPRATIRAVDVSDRHGAVVQRTRAAAGDRRAGRDLGWAPLSGNLLGIRNSCPVVRSTAQARGAIVMWHGRQPARGGQPEAVDRGQRGRGELAGLDVADHELPASVIPRRSTGRRPGTGPGRRIGTLQTRAPSTQCDRDVPPQTTPSP